MENKIQEMQKFFGLKVTGQLDTSTLDMMHRLDVECRMLKIINYFQAAGLEETPYHLQVTL